MKIYDESTNEELTSPDLAVGYLYTSRLVIGHTEESYEIMEGPGNLYGHDDRHPDDGGISYAEHREAETLVSEILEQEDDG